MAKNGLNDYFVPPMPWFGIDIGGTLTKLVYFEPTDQASMKDQPYKNKEEELILTNIRKYLTTNKAYGSTGHRDAHLQLDNMTIYGRIGSLHFIRFPTCQMNSFVDLCKEKGMAKLSKTVCATGGGAQKFQDLIETEMQMPLHKFDEVNSLIRGLEYMETYNRNELYFYDNPQDKATCKKTWYLSDDIVYPFILVNIGSGVSILSVQGPNEYKRVCGTSLGGGTFLGLCCLLTNCNSFDEALELAANGDNKKVDKLVKDIYGEDYGKFGLGAEVVASSFGHMSCKDKRPDAKPEDLARATLVTITNNIGSLVKLCANAENIERVVFVGNFLRINSISMKMLSSAVDFWSKGTMKALFCEHEGYFGAIGCLMELMKNPLSRHI